MKKYDPSEIEPKWQKIWEEKGIFDPDLKKAKKPFYNLMMFPYPSAEGLHVGNVYAFTGADTYGRFKRMQGYDVFEPIGLDGFGIHSENYALKVGRHPWELAKETEKNFYRQLRAIGNAFSWRATLETYDKDYYRWTQWIFIQMFKAGLAYRAKAPVNFCPSCKTTLSDEQVIAGLCERCKTQVEKRELEQWFFKITKYADRLLKNLDWIDWTEKTKIAQRNWIGRSEGAEIKFPIPNSRLQIGVFTTRPDTIFGATFLVLAPESEWVEKLTTPENRFLVNEYIKTSKKRSEIERTALEREKTGVFTGSFVINPATEEKIPVWVGDYVVLGYGTGAVMGVPAHDQRDFDFAKKYNLEVRVVVEPLTGSVPVGKAYEGEGKLVNSGKYSGLKSWEGGRRIVLDLKKKGLADFKVSFRLRDWCVSRQRYWGPPIPMINCQKCGWVPVPEEDLPVELPYLSNWKPLGTGVSPLSQDKDWVRVSCPKCGGQAQRETDVSDTFLDSAWYFFRYPTVSQPSACEVVFDPEITEKWLPVSMYIGGHEHACLHLLYSRFLTMVFKDLGLISFEEPFKRFYAHGLIIAEGAKMSKSRGNVVVPDLYISKYGADTLRCYLRFLGPFDQGGDFRDTGIAGMWRFLNRVWKVANRFVEGEESYKSNRIIHKTIKKVGEDLENLRFNTALAALMEYVNFLNGKERVERWEIEVLALLLAPFAPFLAEEIWCEVLKNNFSVHNQKWPDYDPKLVREEEVVFLIQINGKLRDKIKISSKKGENQSEVEEIAQGREKIKKYLLGKKIKKVIFVPGKLINFVV